MPGMVREKERRVKSRENKKYIRKLAFVRRVVAKERKKNIYIKNTETKINREKMGKARTSPKPVRLSATSSLHVPSSMPGKEKERDRRMGGRAMKKVGKVTSSLFFFLSFFF